MKTYLTYLFLGLLNAGVAFAQPNSERKILYDSQTVVIDSAGQTYGYKHWQDLLQTKAFAIFPKKLTGLHADTAILHKKKIIAKFPVAKFPKPDYQSIVVDLQGKEYGYEEWKKLVAANEARLIFKKGRDTIPDTFQLIRLSVDEKHLRDSLKRAFLEQSKPKESSFFTTGEKVKGLKFKDLDGVKYHAADLEGKVLVFNFWFINCPPCRAEIPQLNTLVEKYKNNPDVVFLALAVDDAYALKDFLDRVTFNFKIIPDGKYTSLGANIRLYPTHLVVGKDGKVLFHTSGGGEKNIAWVERSIREALGI